MNEKKQRQVQFWLEKERIEKLDALAKQTGRTRPGMLRVLIDLAEPAPTADIRVREVQHAG